MDEKEETPDMASSSSQQSHDFFLFFFFFVIFAPVSECGRLRDTEFSKVDGRMDGRVFILLFVSS